MLFWLQKLFNLNNRALGILRKGLRRFCSKHVIVSTWKIRGQFCVHVSSRVNVNGDTDCKKKIDKGFHVIWHSRDSNRMGHKKGKGKGMMMVMMVLHKHYMTMMERHKKETTGRTCWSITSSMLLLSAQHLIPLDEHTFFFVQRELILFKAGVIHRPDDININHLWYGSINQDEGRKEEEA